jgi:response regulator RpfG family c-di-GMP phosphodiesterase
MKILILQDEPGAFFALRKSLEGYHELLVVPRVESALSVLQSEHVDLIISRVHLESGSVFEFLENVKENPRFCQIPFVCFCGRVNKYTSRLDALMSKLSLMRGADKYISLEDYCCDGKCDYDALRLVIDELMS